MNVNVPAALTRKAGPLPRWGWAVVGVLVVGAYLLYRRRAGGTAPGIPESLATQRVSVVPYGSPDASAQWTANGGGMSKATPPSNGLSDDVLTHLGDTQSALSLALADLAASQYAAGSAPFQQATGTVTAPEAASLAVVGPAATSGALPVTTVTAAQKPYGGIKSHKRLKNGSLLTTYYSGRQVQQAPGKPAYVVRP